MLAAFKGIVELKLPINVVVGMAFVENLLGPDAVHPSDIIKSYKGLTVEIGNTDAEGRLILADTMTYVQTKYKPHTMIEMSTLTALRGIIVMKTILHNLTRLGKQCRTVHKQSKVC